MKLDIQLLSIIFSFSYGIIVSYLYNISYSFLYKTSILYRVVINVLFCIDVGLIYFLLLKVINYGVVHIYFVIVFLISFILFSGKYKNLRKCVKLSKSKKDTIDKNN